MKGLGYPNNDTSQNILLRTAALGTVSNFGTTKMIVNAPGASKPLKTLPVSSNATAAVLKKFGVTILQKLTHS
jgi:hypothetical protein